MLHVGRVLAVAGLLAGAALVGAGGPAYADCPVMTFTFDATAGGAVLQPDRLTVDAGGCVTLHNATITSADISVGTFRRTVAAFDSTKYVATAAGTTQPVTATGTAGTAHGSIGIRPRPASTPATRPASPTPTRSASSRPAPAPQPRRSSPSSAVAPTPPAPSAAPPVAQSSTLPVPAVPPSVSPLPSSPVVGSPSASPSAAPAVVAGPLQPPTDRGTGLPAALAALGIVATAAALLRVLLAEPVPSRSVDSRNSVGAAV